MTKYFIKIGFDNPETAIMYLNDILRRGVPRDIKHCELIHEEDE